MGCASSTSLKVAEPAPAGAAAAATPGATPTTKPPDGDANSCSKSPSQPAKDDEPGPSRRTSATGGGKPLGTLIPGGRRTSLQTRQEPALPLSPTSPLRREHGSLNAGRRGQLPPGWGPLHIAADAGDIDAIKALKAASKGGILFVDERTVDSSRSTPLWLAAQAGRVGVIEVLFEEGCSLELANALKQTPLYAACAGGRRDIARLLIARGAAVDKAAADGTTPLFAAVANGHVETAAIALEAAPRLDVKAKDGSTLLGAAVRCGREDMLDEVLVFKSKLDFEARDSQGRTPLYIAASIGATVAIRKLLNKGAQHSAPATDGTTPLWAAAYGGHAGAVAALMAKGAAPRVPPACKRGQPGEAFDRSVSEEGRQAVAAQLARIRGASRADWPGAREAVAAELADIELEDG